MFAYNLFMFHSPSISRDFLVCCKGCRENIPAPCEPVPAQPVAERYPLCGSIGNICRPRSKKVHLIKGLPENLVAEAPRMRSFR